MRSSDEASDSIRFSLLALEARERTFFARVETFASCQTAKYRMKNDATGKLRLRLPVRSAGSSRVQPSLPRLDARSASI